MAYNFLWKKNLDYCPIVNCKANNIYFGKNKKQPETKTGFNANFDDIKVTRLQHVHV